MKFKHLLIYLFLFCSLKNLYAISGHVCFYNQTEHNLQIKYRESNSFKWHKFKLELNEKKKITTTSLMVAPDIEEFKVKVITCNGKNIGTFRWTDDISIKKDKTTNVYFRYNKNRNIPLQFKISYPESGIWWQQLGLIDDIIKKIDELLDVAERLKKNPDKKINLSSWKNPNLQLRFDQVCLLGAHNTFSSKQNNYTYYYQQVYSTKKLLELGVRLILLDFYPTKPGTNVDIKKGKRPVEIKLCHGPCKIGPILHSADFIKYLKEYLIKCLRKFKLPKVSKINKVMESYITQTAVSCLSDITNFLNNNTDQIIAIMIENYADIESTNIAIKDSGIADLVLKPSDWNVFENEGKWPTLNWMINNNKRVVIFDGSLKKDTKYCFAQWNYMLENDYGHVDIEGAIKERRDTKKKSSKGKLNSINFFPGSTLESIKTLVDDIKIGDLNALLKALNIVLDYTQINYEKINSKGLPKLINRIIKDGLINNKKPNEKRMLGKIINFLGIDFVHKGNAMKIVNFFNDFSAQRLQDPNVCINQLFDIKAS